jgi:hypothetical protein
VDSEDARANWARAILAPVRDAGIERGRDAAPRTHELSPAREPKPDAASRTGEGASSLASSSFMGLLDRFDRWVDDDRDCPYPPTAEGGGMTHSAGSQVTDPTTPPLPPPPPRTAAPPGHGYGLSALSQLFSVSGPGEGKGGGGEGGRGEAGAAVGLFGGDFIMAAHGHCDVGGLGGEEGGMKEEEEVLSAPVYQGWLWCREPGLRKYWYNRWGVVRQGRFDIYADPGADERKPLHTIPLNDCRIERIAVKDAHLQRACDFEFGFRVIEARGVSMRLLAGGHVTVFAVLSEQVCVFVCVRACVRVRLWDT